MRLTGSGGRVTGGLLGLTLILSVGGCAEAGDTPLTAEEKAAAIVLAEKLDQALPSAEMRAIEACMAGRGFRFPPAELARPPADNGGYGTRLATGPRPQDDPDLAVQSYLHTLPPARQGEYWETLRPAGSPMAELTLPDGTVVRLATEGCEAAGRAHVYGSVQDYLRITMFPTALASAAPGIASEPDVQASLAVYAGCMSAAGYPVASPSEALKLARERFGSRAPSAPADQAERAMAAADQDCQRRSDIQQRLKSVMADKAAAWLRSANPDIHRLVQARQDAISRAR